METRRPGKACNQPDCEWAARVEEYWAKSLRDVQKQAEETETRTNSLFATVVSKTEVIGDGLEKLHSRVDDGFRAIATEQGGRELELRRWLEDRLGRIEQANVVQDERIRRIGGQAGSAGARNTAAIVSGVIAGVGMGIWQLVQYLQ